MKELKRLIKIAQELPEPTRTQSLVDMQIVAEYEYRNDPAYVGVIKRLFKTAIDRSMNYHNFETTNVMYAG